MAEVERLQEPAGDLVDNVLARMAELTAFWVRLGTTRLDGATIGLPWYWEWCAGA